jgi:hypothetical protein
MNTTNIFHVPLKSDPYLSQSATTEKSVEYAAKIVHDTLDQTSKIAKVLKGNTLDDTCRRIFNFLYKHIQYKPDKTGIEQFRSPARSWADRRTGIDCDCFSIFISSILTNLQIPHSFRFVKLKHREYYQHIYVVVPKNGKSLPKGTLTHSLYYVIDPVLDTYDKEADYITDLKDVEMIPVQYLNGVDDAPGVETRVGREFDGLDGLGLGCTCNQVHSAYNNAMKQHLVNTRNSISSNPSSVNSIYDTEQLGKMLDMAISNWNDPVSRTQILNHLSLIDHLALKPELRPVDGVLYGDFEMSLEGLGAAKKAKVQNKIKAGFFTAVKKAGEIVKKTGQEAKKVGKAVVRYNPLSVAARNGFLLAMKENLFGIAKKLQYGYLTDAQAKQIGFSPAELAPYKAALANVQKMFVDTLQGKPDALKNAIMTGRHKLAVQKIPDNASVPQNGLGEPVTITSLITAASVFIAKVSTWVKHLKDSPAAQKITTIVKKAKDSGVIDKIKSKIMGKKDNASISQGSTDPLTPTNQEISPDYSDASSPVISPAPTPTSDKSSSGMLFVGLAAAAGLMMMSSGSGSSGSKKSLSGTSRKTHKKRKKKSSRSSKNLHKIKL